MTALNFPSADFPAFPVISIDVPDDWQGLTLAGAVIAAAAPEVPGEFRPNVVVSVTRFDAGYALDTAEQAILQKFAGLEQAHEIGRDRVTVEGVEWAHIESTFLDPRAGTLVQAVHAAVVSHGRVADLVQITASVTGSQAQAGLIDTIRTIQRSATARP